MKNYYFTTIKVTTEDMKHISFPSNKSCIIKGTLYQFPSALEMINSIRQIELELTCSDYESQIYIASEEPVAAKLVQSAKTIEEAFREAMDYYRKTNFEYFGQTIKSVSNDAPFMLWEIHSLADALFDALQNKNLTGAEAYFEEFCYRVGFWWLTSLVEQPRAMQLMRDFFDTVFPVVSEK